MPRSATSDQSGAKPAPGSASASQQGGPGNHAAGGGRSGGMGWFRDTGAWMGDKISGATEAVGEWAGN